MNNKVRIGRFMLSVPPQFKWDHEVFEFMFCGVEEHLLPEQGRREKLAQLWGQRMAKIKELEKPEGVDAVLIEQRNLAVNGKRLEAVCYHGHLDGELLSWDALMDAGPVAVWFQVYGDLEYKEDLVSDFLEVAKAYKLPGTITNDDWFHLRYGAIGLPYFEQESASVAFRGEGVARLKIESETLEVEPDQPGLLDKLSAVVESGYADTAGVKVKRLRGGKREVAGLKGEEAIYIMEDGDDGRASMTWEYVGAVDSGHAPNLLIDLEVARGDVESFIPVWDQILDSASPVSNR